MIPSSPGPYRLNYHNTHDIVTSALPLSALDYISSYGANLYEHLTQLFSKSRPLDWRETGALGGKVDMDGVLVSVIHRSDLQPTLEDAYWLLRGIGGAAREKGCVETGQIDVFRWVKGQEHQVTSATLERAPDGESLIS